MTKAEETLLSLVRSAIDGKAIPAEELIKVSVGEWKETIRMSMSQWVSAMAVDGYQNANANVALESGEMRVAKYEWFWRVPQAELSYRQQVAAISSLARLFAASGIRMMVLKGYGLSVDYPIPAHRHAGDLDIYLFGRGEEGDRLVKEKGSEVVLSHDKHSSFSWENVEVENHACFVNVVQHPGHKKLEQFFEEETKNAVPHTEGDVTVWFPSVMTNALFVPLHIACHFVHGDANLRQVCDWACFARSHGNEIDWDKVKTMSGEAGFYPFFRCLNGIVRDKFDVPAECLPDWPSDKALEERILVEIMHSTETEEKLSLRAKVKRYLAGRWKYKMVYNEPFIASFCRRARGYIRRFGKSSKSIWDLN